MLNNIKSSSNNKKTILSNFISLFILQGSMYVIPLILLPYFIRVLGLENYGLLAFATATISFFRAIVEYGFNLSATKQISIYKHNQEKLNEIYTTVLVSKFLLAISGFILLIFITSIFDSFLSNQKLFIYTYLIIFGDVFFAIWFFQGIEKMKIITYIQISYKIFFVMLVLSTVKNESDYILVPILDSIGNVITGIISIYIIKNKYNTSFKTITLEMIIFQLKDAWHIFLSRMTVVLYTSINTFLLGILATNELVGIYSIAEKIYMAIRGLLNPVVQAIYPYLNRKYNESKKLYYLVIRKITLGYFLVLILFSIILYSFSDYLVFLVSGKVIYEASIILKIFSVAIIFSIGTLFSSLLVVKGGNKKLSEITLVCMIINLILVYPSIQFYGIYGLACVFLFVQINQTILLLIYNKEIWR